MNSVEGKGILVKRPYKQEEISGGMLRIISELRLSGKGFLPSERTLCEMLGASRETVRRVLEDFESRGLLLKGVKGRALAVAPKLGPRLVFAATGVEIVGNMTWNRLWSKLSELSVRTDINVSLHLMPWNAGVDSVESLLKDPPEFLVLADAPGVKVKEALLGLKGSSTLIAVDEQDAGVCDYAVHFDNFEGGRMAGRSILDAGYRNPFYLGWMHDFGYVPFQQRGEGFLAALREAGLDAGPERLQWIRAASRRRTAFLRAMMHLCEELAAEDYDSVFYHSDEDIDFIYEIFSEGRSIPEDFGLFAIAGCGLALSHSPPISSLGQGEAGAADAILSLVDSISIGGDAPVPRTVKIKPEPIPGGLTLRRPVLQSATAKLS